MGELLEALVVELKRVCTQKSRGQLFLLLNPDWAWKWIRCGNRQEVEAFSEVTVMELSRWTDGAISNALDRIGLRTGSKSAGQDIFRLTAGAHDLVSRILMKNSIAKKASSVADIVEHANSIKSLWLEEGGSNLLSDLGITGASDLGKAVEELFGLCENSGDDEYLVTEDSFEFATEAFSEASQAREILVEHRTLLEIWLQKLDLISSFSDEGIQFKACPLTLELIQSKQWPPAEWFTLEVCTQIRLLDLTIYQYWFDRKRVSWKSTGCMFWIWMNKNPSLIYANLLYLNTCEGRWIGSDF